MSNPRLELIAPATLTQSLMYDWQLIRRTGLIGGPDSVETMFWENEELNKLAILILTRLGAPAIPKEALVKLLHPAATLQGSPSYAYIEIPGVPTPSAPNPEEAWRLTWNMLSKELPQ